MSALQGDARGSICRLRYRTREREHVFEVKGDSAVLGRAKESDLVLRDESVSRNHALVVRELGGWKIRDLGSRNGIRVNTYRIRHKSLQDGDVVDLGGVRLVIELSPLPEDDSQARVVFQPEHQERGMRTGVIDMGELEHQLAAGPHEAGEDDGQGGPANPLGHGLTSSPYARESAARDGSSNPESVMLLRLVHMAAKVLISCDSLDEALSRILELVFENLPAERGVICLYDETTDTSEAKVMRTRDGVPEEPIVISSRIANDVINRKQSLLVLDTKDDARFGNANSVLELQIHSAMCAPLYHEGRVSGFIYVDQQSGNEPLSTSHLHALSTLAVLSGAAVEQWNLRDSIRREREIRSRLSRYSSPAVVDRIIRLAQSAESAKSADPHMVAEEGDVTVLFADLAGFTEMAESLHASQVAQLLNHVFERLTEVVFAKDGTLDKFSGDGMMAFFGAPLPLADHAERAVEAALAIQEEIQELNVESLYGRKLSVRIGLNSGLVVVGDVGSPQRKDYTVIGDVVNTASRLEHFVAEPGQIVVGPKTYELVRDRFRAQELPAVRLKGKSREVQPYLILGRRTSPAAPEPDPDIDRTVGP